jgi:hypothetical protein
MPASTRNSIAIDEAWEQRLAGQLDDLGARRDRYLRAGAGRFDPLVAHKDDAIGDRRLAGRGDEPGRTQRNDPLLRMTEPRHQDESEQDEARE